jgi:hypothetical protein
MYCSILVTGTSTPSFTGKEFELRIRHMCVWGLDTYLMGRNDRWVATIVTKVLGISIHLCNLLPVSPRRQFSMLSHCGLFESSWDACGLAPELDIFGPGDTIAERDKVFPSWNLSESLDEMSRIGRDNERDWNVTTTGNTEYHRTIRTLYSYQRGCSWR